jgi:hypothetical protein
LQRLIYGGQRGGQNKLMRRSFLVLRTSRAPRPKVDAKLGDGRSDARRSAC